MQINTTILSVALAVFISTSAADAARWAFDNQHCKAIFSVPHAGGLAPVTGWFNEMYGFVDFDGTHVDKTKIDVQILAKTLNTGCEARDFHLRTDHFFDMDHYPFLSFKSTEVKPTGKGRFDVLGVLEIRGKKRPVRLECKGPTGPIVDVRGRERIGVTGVAHFNRKDFGMTWNREEAKGAMLVGDEVDVSLEIELTKARTAKGAQRK